VGLERGPLSLVSTIEELLDRKVAAPVYKTETTAVGIRHADHVAPSIRKKLAITSPTSGGRSVGMVRSRTQTIEFSLVLYTRCSVHELKSNFETCMKMGYRVRGGNLIYFLNFGLRCSFFFFFFLQTRKQPKYKQNRKT
jgi:hypothetical protein